MDAAELKAFAESAGKFILSDFSNADISSLTESEMATLRDLADVGCWSLLNKSLLEREALAEKVGRPLPSDFLITMAETGLLALAADLEEEVLA